MTETPPPGDYEWLDFNAPMSHELAESLAGGLARTAPDAVLDVGCGWGELLLRVLAAAPNARGVGIDANITGLARARRNATSRGLERRVEFREQLPDATVDAADVVVCIGADHIFGTQEDALRALYKLVRPGGRLLFGSGFWESPPTNAQAASIGAKPEELASLADLVDLAIAVGFRPLDLRSATRREWEEFELGYLADWEEWLVRHADDEAAPEILERSDTHRTEYLRGWRTVLGFAYLTLGRPTASR